MQDSSFCCRASCGGEGGGGKVGRWDSNGDKETYDQLDRDEEYMLLQ